jgi:hypothetical protein
MIVAQNNEFKFQRLLKHHPIYGEGQHAKHPPTRQFFMKDDVNDEVFNGTPKTLIPFDGVLN